MTGFIVKPFHDRVEILSDGALYSEDGILLGTAEKVIPSGLVPLAVIGSGRSQEIGSLSEVVLMAAAVTRSFDKTIEMLSNALASIAQSPNYDTGLRLVVAGISEAHGPVAYIVSTFADAASKIPAFRLERMFSIFAQGAYPTQEQFQAYFEASGSPFDVYHGLERDSVFLMGAMREQKLPNPANPNAPLFHKVGGHIDLTVIRAEGISTKRLHEWPDVVGQPIDPFAVTNDDDTTFDDGTTYAA